MKKYGSKHIAGPSLICLISLVFSVLIFSGSSSADIPLSGSPVQKITVEGLHTVSEEEFLDILGIKTGEPLNRTRAGAGIRMLFLKGIFEDITIDSEGAEKPEVRIKVRERDLIRRIHVYGNEMLSSRVIKGHFLFREGQVMRYDLIDRSIGELKSALAERGFPNADVKMDIEKTGRPYRVNLLITVKEGPPDIIKSIRVIGPADAIELLELSEGDVFDRFRLRGGIEKIRTYYKKNNYLSPVIGPVNFSDGNLEIYVGIGKKINILFEGNSEIDAKTLMKEAPFFEAEDFRDDLIEEAVSRMTSLYHANGYPFAQIAPVVTYPGDDINVHFFIYEGDEVRVGSVKFIGTTIPEKNLGDIMSLRPGDLYNPGIIDSDRKTLEEFYNALGYLEAVVSEVQVGIKESRADIIVTVSEGARTYVDEIEITGAESVPLEEIRRVVMIKTGEPYNEVDVSDSRYKIIDLYGNSGYTNVRVDIRQEKSDKGVKVVFAIEEGRVYYFGKTVISGNLETRHKVIERELLYREGSPYNYSLVSKSRQRLYKLGLFTDVDIENIEKEGNVRDVHIKLREGNAGIVEFGLGYGDYERYRGSFDLSYRNLFGMNRQISFRTELSSLERRFIINYLEPWFLNKPVPFRFLLIREDRTEKSIETRETRYKLKRHTASAGFEKKFDDKWKGEIFYEFSVVKTFDVKPDVILSKEDTGTIAISGIRPGIAYDTRDNPFDPRKGILAGVSFKAASNALLSETDFVKGVINLSFYRELNRHLVFAAAFKTGLAQGFNDTRELPLVERFFLGGRTTVRGYEQDTLGPKGVNGSPTGGNAFVLTNIELRTYVGSGFGFVTFLDGGNVWIKTSDIEPSEIKYTAGFGIRYNTPVGPVRVDYGHKLAREAGESRGEIHFTIGHAF